MRLLAGMAVDDQVYELLVKFGVRHLLGLGKGTMVMDALKEHDRIAYEQIIIEAQKQYDQIPKDALPENAGYESDTFKEVLSHLMAASLFADIHKKQLKGEDIPGVDLLKLLSQ